MNDTPLLASVLLIIASLATYAYLGSRLYMTYLVEDREFSHEAAARDYIASFTDDVPRRIIRRRRFQWRSAP